jgi:Asp-tRNA(Asn)/Glu-tRNA(Gln) amidotransferase A subunit family amidase
MDFRDALIGFADWQGYGHGERAAAWAQRLEVNRPEIEIFRAAPTPPSAAYLPRATRVEGADGVAANESSLPADAVDALARARGRRELNAFTFLPDALAPAGAGFLAGVPIAVKDLMAVKGMPLTGGSKAFERVEAARDAEVIARLRRAGAVVIGLTNLHEFAYGVTSDNPHFGRVVNPVAPSRIPGGSSGGSAAAIAAGIVRLAIGTDTGGSIRIPAACCGIVGFKPSYDALPRSGVLDLAYSLDHVGPMGRTVEDCAAMFAAMLELPAIPKWRRASLSGATVARLGGYFAEPLDGEVRAALDAAMLALAADGARCIDRRIEGVELSAAIMLNTISPEATAFHAERVKARGQDYGEDVRVRVETGFFLPAPWYVKAQRMRTRLVESIEAAFGEADVFICPTMRAPAPQVGASRAEIEGKSFALHTSVTNLTVPFNLSGLPAISVPWSLSADGVPISLQIVGKRGHDWRVLSFARRLELASRWNSRPTPR